MKYKIAIVDDEQQIVHMLEKFLSKNENFIVKTFSNPSIALNSIDTNNCDLVLLDIMMPQIDGIEFLRQIKSKNPNIEVIMMTAFSTLERVLQSHKLGAENFLTKPFSSLKEVENKIYKALKIA